jgi:hypothetical protein
MNNTDMNKFVIGFIRTMDLRKSHDKQIEAWKLYNKQNSVKKPVKKNSYLFYVELNKEKLKNQYPDLKNKEIVSKLSEGWAELKRLDNDEYKGYCEMSDNYNTVNNNEYEVSKPFHKFSMEFRKIIEDENPDHKAQQITDILIEKWKALSKLEKKEWEL